MFLTVNTELLTMLMTSLARDADALGSIKVEVEVEETSSLVRIYAQTPILYLMDFLCCTQIIHKSKLFNAHISKKSTTGWLVPCAKTQNLDQYIPHCAQRY